MTWDNLIDTFLNLGVFVFIGLLIQLYRKPTDDQEPR
jgi:hypothetical protein